MLEWVVISFSRGSSRPKDWIHISCSSCISRHILYHCAAWEILRTTICCCCLVAKLWAHGLQHARLLCLSLSPRVCLNSCPLSWWCHPIISSSVIPFSSLVSFPACPGTWVFSNTTVQKHQFFSAQPSSQSNSHIHTWPQEKPWPWLDEPLLAK